MCIQVGSGRKQGHSHLTGIKWGGGEAVRASRYKTFEEYFIETATHFRNVKA